MNIADNTVVSFHYTLKNTQGATLESSHEGDPLSYLHGSGNIIPGLENALAGRTQGDEFSVTVEPAEAYGEINQQLITRLPIKYLKSAGKLRAGTMAVVETQQGLRQVQVLKVGRFHADVDANHPLAGQALTFEVKVIEVREASAEEIAHGHVHGPGGHHHGEEE